MLTAEGVEGLVVHECEGNTFEVKNKVSIFFYRTWDYVNVVCFKTGNRQV